MDADGTARLADFMAGLAKLPDERPSSAEEFAKALQLPHGTQPAHLLTGSRSAVTPVIAGLSEELSAPRPS